MQLADELPMIYTTCIMAYATLTYSKSPRFSFLAAVGLTGLAWWITVRYHPIHPLDSYNPRISELTRSSSQAYYLSAKDPVFHQVAYGIMTALIIVRSMMDMEYELRPALRQRNPEECDKTMKEMWKLALTGK